MKENKNAPQDAYNINCMEYGHAYVRKRIAHGTKETNGAHMNLDRI